MLKNVQIVDKNTGNIVANYPVILETTDASDEDYFDEAWENAVDDGVVDAVNVEDYVMEFVEDIPRE